jgi:hypothetical protein
MVDEPLNSQLARPQRVGSTVTTRRRGQAVDHRHLAEEVAGADAASPSRRPDAAPRSRRRT